MPTRSKPKSSAFCFIESEFIDHMSSENQQETDHPKCAAWNFPYEYNILLP